MKIPHHVDQNEIDREVDDFFAAGARLTKALVRWFKDHQANDQGERAGAVETSQRIETSAPTQGEPLMTAEELGAYLKLQPQTLRDWARDGRIPSQPVNGERRFRLSEINQWLESQREKIEKSSPIQTNTVVESSRSFLRPQQSRRKSNGRV